VDARETWQALQARLTAARAAVDEGNRDRALAEITAALAIDPNFLAAHSLRDSILEPDAAPSAQPVAALLPSRADLSSRFGEPPDSSPAGHASEGGLGMPSTSTTGDKRLVSPQGYAKFEQRAKRRRVDRRLDAARAAMASGKLKAAAAALDEVIELDPNLPDLLALTAQFDDLRRTAAAARRGPRLAAAAVFVLTVLGASWLRESTELISRPMIAAAPLVAPPTPAVSVSSETVATGTAGERLPIRSAVAVSPPAPAVAAPMPVPSAADVLDIEPPTVAAFGPATVPAAAASAAMRPLVHDAPAAAPLAAPLTAPAPPPAAAVADDQILVKQTLQRYRTAYEGLDAQSAHSVWPAVNQAALARAFDGLESQTLTFDACVVRVRGESATATCEGSARYVPKVGSREPRVEPRTWNFTLRKAGTDWKIDSARAER
jgi:hypothetical protein